MTKTTERLSKAMDAKLEILKITMGQLVTTIEKKNITSADRLRKKKGEPKNRKRRNSTMI